MTDSHVISETLSAAEREMLTAEELAAVDLEVEGATSYAKMGQNERSTPPAPEAETEAEDKSPEGETEAEAGDEQEAEATEESADEAEAEAEAEAAEGEESETATEEEPAEAVATPAPRRVLAPEDPDIPEYQEPNETAEAREGLAAALEKRKGLTRQWKEGDIDPDEYTASMADLSDEIDELRTAVRDADFERKDVERQRANQQSRREVAQKHREQLWAEAIQVFAGEDGNDIFDHDTDLAQQLWGIVQGKAEAGALDEPQATHVGVLRDAKAELFEIMRKRMAAFGLVANEPATDPTPPKKPSASVKEAGKARAKKEAGKIADAPKTLAGAPPAATEGTDGKFSHLEGLTGMDFEQAVAAMSAKQLEEWIARG